MAETTRPSCFPCRGMQCRLAQLAFLDVVEVVLPTVATPLPLPLLIPFPPNPYDIMLLFCVYMPGSARHS